MSEVKLGIVAAAVVLVIFTLSLNIGRTITLMTAMKAGYCEVSRPGTHLSAWQQCDQTR